MTLLNKKAESSVSLSVKIIISVLIGALLMTGVYFIIDNVVVPGMIKTLSQQNKLQEDNESIDAFNHSGIIPEGGVYCTECGTFICSCGAINAIDNPGGCCDDCFEDIDSPTATYTAGQSFPTVRIGDVYVYDDYYYTFDNDGWKVGVLDKSKKTYGTILKIIENKPIISMDCAFSGCTSLTVAPIVPRGVINMNYAFSGCNLLKTAPNIPAGVTSMKYTFSDCTSLTKAPVISADVIDMSYTFKNCTSLTTAPVIPSTVTNLTSTFHGCKSLKTAPNIPAGVINMKDTFNECISLVTPPDMSNATNVTDMCSTFYNCKALTVPPTIPNGVTEMGTTFVGCTSLTTAPVIPSTVTSLYATFANCTSLKSVSIMSSKIKELGDSMFYNCTSLTNVYIPKTISKINEQAFGNCCSLISITFNDTRTKWYSINKHSDWDKGTGDKYVVYCTDDKEEKYGAWFKDGTFLTWNELKLESNGKRYNYDASKITDESIIDVFTKASSLKEIRIPEGIKEIGSFTLCYSLEYVSIPNSITYMKSYTFGECENLRYNYVDGVAYLGNKTNPYLVLMSINNENITSFNVPKSVKVISEYAFSKCNSLKTVNLNNVECLLSSTLLNCTSLTDIYIGSSMNTICNNAFPNHSFHIYFDGVKSRWRDLISLTDVTCFNDVEVICTDDTIYYGHF